MFKNDEYVEKVKVRTLLNEMNDLLDKMFDDHPELQEGKNHD